ncbi:unnamed protein product, partial [Ilex paraguariensis]
STSAHFTDIVQNGAKASTTLQDVTKNSCMPPTNPNLQSTTDIAKILPQSVQLSELGRWCKCFRIATGNRKLLWYPPQNPNLQPGSDITKNFAPLFKKTPSTSPPLVFIFPSAPSSSSDTQSPQPIEGVSSPMPSASYFRPAKRVVFNNGEPGMYWSSEETQTLSKKFHQTLIGKCAYG